MNLITRNRLFDSTYMECFFVVIPINQDDHGGHLTMKTAATSTSSHTGKYWLFCSDSRCCRQQCGSGVIASTHFLGFTAHHGEVITVTSNTGKYPPTYGDLFIERGGVDASHPGLGS